MSSHICRACLCSLNKPTDAVDIFTDLYKYTYNLSMLLSELFNIKVNFTFGSKKLKHSKSHFTDRNQR